MTRARLVDQPHACEPARAARRRPWIAAIVLAIAGGATAQPTDPPVPPSAPAAPPASAPPPAQAAAPTREPTLDELLGIAPAPEADALPDPSATELQRRLDPDQVSEEFTRAATLMRESADRLSRAGDAGITTQRMHEDILRALDKLIADAQQNQQRSQSSSSSSSSSSGSQQQQPGQQSSQQQQGQQASASASSSTGTGGVPMQDGARNPLPPGSGASWGNLPPHVRDALLQGFADRFSSAYKSLTEEYYRRLSEESPGATP